MVSDLVAYGLLASIFVVTTLRMFVDKPGRLTHRPQRLFERLRRAKKRVS
jgi:hypothetical protein